MVCVDNSNFIEMLVSMIKVLLVSMIEGVIGGYDLGRHSSRYCKTRGKQKQVTMSEFYLPTFD